MNLRQLLAMQLVLALAWVLVSSFSRPLIYSRWGKALHDLNEIRLESKQVVGPTTRIDAVQRWLEGKVLQSDSSKFQLVLQPPADPWGNAFQAIEHVDDEGARQIEFFSFGRDGKSSSSGNDPDDINTWSAQTVQFYQREEQRASWLHQMQWTIPVAILLYIPVWFMLRTRRNTEHVGASLK